MDRLEVRGSVRPRDRMRTPGQRDRFSSPWSIGELLRMQLWRICWTLLCRPTPKHLFRWRNLVLRAFGCRIHGAPFVASSAVIQIPWHVELGDRACVGDKAVLYSLGRIVIGARTTIAQESYLCTGTHDFSHSDLPLMVGDIVLGREVFIGARAFVLPGVSIGDGTVVGAASVVVSDLQGWVIAAGNPCVVHKARQFADRSRADDGGQL